MAGNRWPVWTTPFSAAGAAAAAARRRQAGIPEPTGKTCRTKKNIASGERAASFTGDFLGLEGGSVAKLSVGLSAKGLSRHGRPMVFALGFARVYTENRINPVWALSAQQLPIQARQALRQVHQPAYPGVAFGAEELGQQVGRLGVDADGKGREPGRTGLAHGLAGVFAAQAAVVAVQVITACRRSKAAAGAGVRTALQPGWPLAARRRGGCSSRLQGPSRACTRGPQRSSKVFSSCRRSWRRSDEKPSNANASPLPESASPKVYRLSRMTSITRRSLSAYRVGRDTEVGQQQGGPGRAPRVAGVGKRQPRPPAARRGAPRHRGRASRHRVGHAASAGGLLQRQATAQLLGQGAQREWRPPRGFAHAGLEASRLHARRHERGSAGSHSGSHSPPMGRRGRCRLRIRWAGRGRSERASAQRGRRPAASGVELLRRLRRRLAASRRRPRRGRC